MMRDWDFFVQTDASDYANTFDITMVVRIPRREIRRMYAQSYQLEIVDYVARRLRDYVMQEFKQGRLPASSPGKAEKEGGRG